MCGMAQRSRTIWIGALAPATTICPSVVGREPQASQATETTPSSSTAPTIEAAMSTTRRNGQLAQQAQLMKRRRQGSRVAEMMGVHAETRGGRHVRRRVVDVEAVAGRHPHGGQGMAEDFLARLGHAEGAGHEDVAKQAEK